MRKKKLNSKKTNCFRYLEYLTNIETLKLL